MARLYGNENFPLPVVVELRRLGHDVLTIQETGKGGQAMTDPDVLRFAKAERRAILTLNRKHFIRLHHEVPDHAGIVACTFDAEFAAQAQRIHDLVQQETTLSGKLLRVNKPPN